MTGSGGPGGVVRSRGNPVALPRVATGVKHFDHNAHYHRFLLRQVPPGARTALDLGCGTGLFARRLAARGLVVTAVDRHGEVDVPGVAFRRADAVVDDIGGPYDFVSCIAALHHMPLRSGLARLRSLVRPGGVVAVLGPAREEGVRDRALSLASVPLNFVARLVRDDPADDAPTRDPVSSLREIRAEAASVLPGARFRRHLYWRYSMVWRAGSTN
ncbi:methyltransferase family protein [Saccharothrix saharensis]|uniref:Methyltransferase family protein n=1 Tax=Saccharothrix saharensis TaxID=571190 RepID=A0A543JM93_9PSEU|nr:class I SAM-dependent methyltransferase [Saccharothrix saharensis]TQM83961.1 methyltransferase family protein [Saccharothrix saharensis]